MKYFVFSDVHGHYSLLISKLKELGFDENNENHMLISLGDNFDRGSENLKMYDFLKEMKTKNKIILVKGNHEDLLLKILYRGYATDIDDRNGTTKTLHKFISRYFDEEPKTMFMFNAREVYYKLRDEGVIDFLYEMKDYFETSKYIFTHAFIPIDQSESCYLDDWRNADRDLFYASRWINGIQMSMDFNIHEPGKKIVVGHYHTSYGHVKKNYPHLVGYNTIDLEFSDDADFSIYEDDNIIAIDACTNYTKQINILVVED